MSEEFLGQTIPPHDHESPEVVEEYEIMVEKNKLMDTIAPHRNYSGEWTKLFYNRLGHVVTKDRFLKSKEKFETEEKRTSGHYEPKHGQISLQKPNDVPIDHYVAAQAGYDKNREHVFADTEYAEAKEYYKRPEQGGVSKGYGHHGVVFDDAVTGELKIKYTERQRDIIRAHEKAHGIFDRLTNAEKEFILLPFDRVKIGYGQKAHADEVVARMSQLKNYFGFCGDEEFKLEHLNYARENYVKDTGLDNNMSDFFNAIMDDKKFVELMNTIAC